MQLFLPYKDLTTKTLPIHLKYILNRRLKCNIVLKCFDHHDSHAASAIYGLNWENGVCVTLDGWGDGFSSSFSVIQNGKLTPLARVDCLDSIGTLYNRVTKALGFKSNRHEGKVMGLAAYGNSYQVCQKFQSITDGSILGVSKFGVSDLTDSQVYKKL
jgi:carbamoyltransferase